MSAGKIIGWLFILVLLLGVTVNATSRLVVKPLSEATLSDDTQSVRAQSSPSFYNTITPEVEEIYLTLPLPGDTVSQFTAELKPFTILSPAFVCFSGAQPASTPQVKLLRGSFTDDPYASVYIAILPDGQLNGIVNKSDGSQYTMISTSDDETIISRNPVIAEYPEFPEFCGVDASSYGQKIFDQLNKSAGDPVYKMKLAHVALDCDHDFVNLFSSETDAQNYAVIMLGAVSDIYIRDINVKLTLSFLRTWPTDTEPFDANSLSSFLTHWHDNEDTTGLQVVHMLSGRRNLSYGGVAYAAGVCSGDAYSISGYLNGSFAALDKPSQANWDVIVMAHEIGHNFGTLHTHDGYDPLIDSCAQGFPTIGTIMSYCHIHPGYTSNSEFRFHGRVIDFLKTQIAGDLCLFTDCNDNGIDDSLDINQFLTSSDVNGNGIPDECEDCNSNGVLDENDIIAGAADVDANGIPDMCEPDCNGNGFPDSIDISLVLSDDENYNYIPDECEPDCNGNTVLDYMEIKNGVLTDYDRDLVPDICQDCDNNGIIDWIDMESQYHLFTADIGGDYIRQYHSRSGVPTDNYGTSLISDPHDLLFGSDNELYVASFGNNEILKIDPELSSTAVFAGPAENVAAPSAICFLPDGNMLVANFFEERILRYNQFTGEYIGEFVTTGLGGLSGPYDMTFGPNGNLFVTSLDNRILEFDGSTGAYIGDFISSGLGGLNDPRGLVFTDVGQLLVSSYATNSVIAYDATSGALIGTFNDEVTLTSPWGITQGPNGNIYVSRSAGTPRIIEYTTGGRYYRSFVRGDNGMINPSAITFRPQSEFDCNGNGIADACDISSGFSLDENSDGRPDECILVDNDSDGIDNVFDNCPDVPNPGQEDNDNDGIGNACCCLGLTGNVNYDVGDQLDISDLLYLVDYFFGAVQFDLPCPDEAEMTNASQLDISDLLFLVDFFFLENHNLTIPNCP